jgi:Protein of unknown function (DUF3592)
MRTNLLFPIALLLIFGVGGLVVSKDAWHAYTSQSWPTVTGDVVKSEWRHYGGKGCHLVLRFNYVYTVQGKNYRGDNYRFGGECGKEVQDIVSAHPVNSEILIHYQPGDPALSVIAAGEISGDTKTGLISMPILMLLALMLLWFTIKNRDR